MNIHKKYSRIRETIKPDLIEIQKKKGTEGYTLAKQTAKKKLAGILSGFEIDDISMEKLVKRAWNDVNRASSPEGIAFLKSLHRFLKEWQPTAEERAAAIIQSVHQEHEAREKRREEERKAKKEDQPESGSEEEGTTVVATKTDDTIEEAKEGIESYDEEKIEKIISDLLIKIPEVKKIDDLDIKLGSHNAQVSGKLKVKKYGIPIDIALTATLQNAGKNLKVSLDTLKSSTAEKKVKNMINENLGELPIKMEEYFEDLHHKKVSQIRIKDGKLNVYLMNQPPQDRPSTPKPDSKGILDIIRSAKIEDRKLKFDIVNQVSIQDIPSTTKSPEERTSDIMKSVLGNDYTSSIAYQELETMVVQETETMVEPETIIAQEEGEKPEENVGEEESLDTQLKGLKNILDEARKMKKELDKSNELQGIMKEILKEKKAK